MDYQGALEYLATLHNRGWRLGLDRMLELIRRAGLEDAIGRGVRSPRFVHIAGTNGKGSVTAYVQSMLVESGYATGAYYSPYVVSPRERIQVGRSFITREDFAFHASRIREAAESLEAGPFGGPTEFEFKTAMGFDVWKHKRREWVALEVGLGGRLDATNVVTPEVSVIVSIGWDHMAILGDTLERIAAEKAGIIKPGVPVVVGALSSGPAAVTERIAEQRGSPVWRFGREIRLEHSGDAYTVETPRGRVEGLVPGLSGAPQPHNMALAVAALQAAGAARSDEALRRGALRTSLPGRMQRLVDRGQPFLLDGAHNVSALEALLPSLEDAPYVVVAGFLSGHEVEPFFRLLRGLASEVHLSPIDFYRTRDPFEVRASIRHLFPVVEAHAELPSALQAAREAARGKQVIFVTGSFYLVGEVLRLLERFEVPAGTANRVG